MSRLTVTIERAIQTLQQHTKRIKLLACMYVLSSGLQPRVYLSGVQSTTRGCSIPPL